MKSLPPTSVISRSRRSHLWLGGSLVIVLLQSAHAICYPIARDQATYCLIGQGILHGMLPYRDFWDNKPPGVFYLYAMIVKAFGTSMWSVGVVDFFWLILISVCIFKFTEQYLGAAPAFIAVVMHSTWRAEAGYWDAAQPENFLILLVFAAYFLSQYKGKLWWACDFLSGTLFGAAFWLKYNAVAFLPLLLVVPHLDFSPLSKGALPRFTVSRREYLKRFAVWWLAFALSVAAVVGCMAYGGAWPAMKEIQLVVLPRYNALAIQRIPHYWRFAGFYIGLYLGWWSVLAGAVALLIARRTRDLPRTAPVFLATAMGCLSTAMQARLPSYAFETCFPFFAMLWGYVALRTFEGFRHIARLCWARGLRLAAILVWVVLANIIYLPLPDQVAEIKVGMADLQEWHRDPGFFYQNYPWARPISHYDGQTRVIRYLEENSTPQDGVLIWGSEPLIYFLAGRNPPTRFISNLGLISLWTPPAWREQLIYSLEAAPPKFIVVARHDWVPKISFNNLDSEHYLLEQYPALEEFVQNGYEKAADYNDFAIFRRD